MFTTAGTKTGTQPNEIVVTVKDGVVILTGCVDDILKKVVAERAASRVRGVKAVVNEIEIRLPTAFQRIDVGITSR